MYEDLELFRDPMMEDYPDFLEDPDERRLSMSSYDDYPDEYDDFDDNYDTDDIFGDMDDDE